MNGSERDEIGADRIQEFFDAISRGNLTEVRALLEGDLGLLYADLVDRNSPAIDALDSGHHDVTDYLAREEIRRLGEGAVPHQHLYRVIHDLGEVAHAETGYPLAEEFRPLAEPAVASFLHHEDPGLRYIALNVLGLHWNLQTHRGTFASMMFDDPDDDVRRMATACLGFVLERSREWEATKTLLRKLRDRNEDPSVRETAYEALLSVWFDFHFEHKYVLKVMEARRPLEQGSEEAGARNDWNLAGRLWEQAGHAWEDHIDRDFIAALERGEEP